MSEEELYEVEVRGEKERLLPKPLYVFFVPVSTLTTRDSVCMCSEMYSCMCGLSFLSLLKSPYALYLIKKRCVANAPIRIRNERGEDNLYSGTMRGIQSAGEGMKTEREAVWLSAKMSRVETGLVALHV